MSAQNKNDLSATASPLTDSDDLQQQLSQVQILLARHRAVDKLVHQQQQQLPQSELIESLVHKQHLLELQLKLAPMHPADIAYILEALPL